MIKRLFYLSMVILTIVACKSKSDEPAAPAEQTQTDPVVPGEPASKPNWQAVVNPEFPGSMAITCLPPEGETVTADDEVAAFWGDTCRAVAGQVNGIFYMVVVGPQNTLPMEVRYYSATYETIRSTNISFEPDSILGSTDEPYRLQL